MSEAAELAAALVAIESTNPDLVPGGTGEQAVARFVADWCTEAGLDVELTDAAPGRPNVVAIARGSGGGRSLLLNGHTDTVGLGGPRGTATPAVEDGRVYGRGSYDMKGGLAAAMLAAQGLLGHQHANSGWGTFDDDNMVGATAFMETLELALELRRANYGDRGERLGFDLYPYTEDAVGAVRRSVLAWNFIDGIAQKLDGDELRAAQQSKDAVRAHELVFAALGGK